MTTQVNHVCDTHPNAYDCPDKVVDYIPKFREYGILVHDGGTSKLSIRFCPWCGSQLPDSQRDRWFSELGRRGIEPGTEDVPSEYTDETWLST